MKWAERSYFRAPCSCVSKSEHFVQQQLLDVISLSVTLSSVEAQGTAAATMLPATGRQHCGWVHYTTSCNTQSSAPEDE